MADHDIRQLRGDEKWHVLRTLTNYAFRSSPPLMDKEKWMEKVKDREEDIVWGLFEKGKPVACTAESVMRQHVRGRMLSMSGIWGVATHPAARRRGFAKQLLKKILSHAQEKGRAVSCLYPFRESFYERLGYVTFPQPKKVTMDTQSMASALNLELEGTVEMVGIKDGYERYKDFLASYQSQVHGMSLSESGHRHRAQENECWLAFARHKDQDIGLMAYALKGEHVTQFKMEVSRFYYLNSLGKYLLLNWMARHIDQAKEIEVWLPPDERPETWLSNLNLSTRQLYIPPMGRILNVADLEGIEVGSGRIQVHVQDPFCPWQEGMWVFQSQDGKLTVQPSSKADFTLTIQGLSALLYGTHAVEDFPYRAWGDPSPELMDTLKRMFPTQNPYLHEFF
ncbi:MAG: GNAT family N-acetyltransferase [Anaerolineales bacterium]